MEAMTLVFNSFSFPNLADVADVEPPMVSAREINDNLAIIRVLFTTSGTLVMNPEISGGTGNRWKITFETSQAAAPSNPNDLWYAEFETTDVDSEVCISVLDKRDPNQTSRGTKTTVQSGTVATIDE